MARLNLTSAMLLDNKSLLTALEPATEPCSDSAWVEGPGPITKLLPEMAPTSFDNLDAPISTCLGLTCKNSIRYAANTTDPSV
jgi:hypothetical protein